MIVWAGTFCSCRSWLCPQEVDTIFFWKPVFDWFSCWCSFYTRNNFMWVYFSQIPCSGTGRYQSKLSLGKKIISKDDFSNSLYISQLRPFEVILNKTKNLRKYAADHLFFDEFESLWKVLREGVKKKTFFFRTLSQTLDPTHPPRTCRTPLSER